MKKFEETTISTNQIFSGNVISVKVDDVKLPDGTTSKREIVKHPGAVAVIAITDDNNILFVEQYRKPLEKTLIEIPAGKLEQDEDPYDTALRELEEETGYSTDKLEYVTSFYTSPGFADEIIYLYYTDQVSRLEEKVYGGEDEFVEVKELPLDEALTLVQEQKIHDAKTMYTILYLQLLKGTKNA